MANCCCLKSTCSNFCSFHSFDDPTEELRLPFSRILLAIMLSTTSAVFFMWSYLCRLCPFAILTILF